MTNPENNLANYTKGGRDDSSSSQELGGSPAFSESTTRNSACAKGRQFAIQQAECGIDTGVDASANLQPAEPEHFTVPDEYAGLRLDQVLVKFFPEYSRSRLQEWIVQHQVTVDGEFATAKQKVWGGEKLAVLPQSHPAEQPYLPEDIALDIVYEDDALLVINKPVGLVVHPGSGNWEGTLLNALLHHAPQLAEIPRAGIVHRLDKDTSGLLVVAKTLTAQTALVRQLEARSVQREYLALVHGELTRAGKVDAPIGRHPSQRVKMAVVEHGKPAVTHYQIEMKFPSCTLLRCRLETGRTHQIRVHLAQIGYPLVGDGVYLKGPQKCVPKLRGLLNGFPRQALHATRLALEHPVTGERMEWHAPLPQDMVQLLLQIKAIVNEPA
ncbi:MAG: 23S rRNA pseudouridine(1911/1915/1917) synthase RluD [Nitrosomonadales bacterium]|nr:23S rRNA pseudouridine(1911/1915/1917) synthase RluD [Nitrosomonadales bacterium]